MGGPKWHFSCSSSPEKSPERGEEGRGRTFFCIVSPPRFLLTCMGTTGRPHGRVPSSEGGGGSCIGAGAWTSQWARSAPTTPWHPPCRPWSGGYGTLIHGAEGVRRRLSEPDRPSTRRLTAHSGSWARGRRQTFF
jgi:hypothetical protein